LGPALILVINPVIQYTVFEQLKNFLVENRTNKVRAAGATTAVAILSDWDYLFLGALSKLGAIPARISQISVLKYHLYLKLPQVQPTLTCKPRG
jgi:adenine nucleotide transporter 17